MKNNIMNWIDEYLKVDSLKIFIPEKLITFRNYEKLITYNELTGEIVGEKFRLVSNSNGYSLTFKKVNLFGTVYYTIVLTSKLLHSRYFEKITEYNIDLIYQNLILDFPDVVFKFTLEQFLSFNVNDIDLAADFKMNQNDIDRWFVELRKLLKQTHLYHYKSNYHINGYSGFQFLFRGYNKSKHLYFKIYNKKYEFLTKSTEFLRYIDINTVPDDMFRLEYNFLNSKQIRKYLLKDTSVPLSLNNVLSLHLTPDYFFNFKILKKTYEFEIDKKNKKDVFIRELINIIKNNEQNLYLYKKFLEDTNQSNQYNIWLNSPVDIGFDSDRNVNYAQFKINKVLDKFYSSKSKSFYYRMKKLIDSLFI